MLFIKLSAAKNAAQCKTAQSEQINLKKLPPEPQHRPRGK